jgi:GTPase SAR1 family protein
MSKTLVMSTDTTYPSVLSGLKSIYKGKIMPAESASLFNHFYSSSLSDNDIDAKPIVLLLGQYSTGKTTFINYLLGRNYPGSHIGPEPTTDKFIAIMGGESDRVIPGNAAAVQSDLPFGGLSQFGTPLLSKFNVSCCKAPLTELITLIDTPGVLSGDKQRLGRAYDYGKVVEWFAERADTILLLFDANKLDISDEFRDVLRALKGHDDKIKIVLNKTDVITTQQLMRVYGALMWSLGKVIQSPEVMRVYVCSFWTPPSTFIAHNTDLISAEHEDLLKDLHDLPRQSAIRKVNELVKRARQVKVHAYILESLRREMPTFFGFKSKQSRLLNNLTAEFTKVQSQYNLPPGDFPDIELFQEKLRTVDLSSVPKISSRLMASLNETLSTDLPNLLREFPQDLATFDALIPKNPFSQESLANFDPADPAIWTVRASDRQRYLAIFQNLGRGSSISGLQAKAFFEDSGLSESDLAQIWQLADRDCDGSLCEPEFAVAMHLIQLRIRGIELPESLGINDTKP